MDAWARIEQLQSELQGDVHEAQERILARLDNRIKELHGDVCAALMHKSIEDEKDEKKARLNDFQLCIWKQKYGFTILNMNVFQLNFSGSSDWLYAVCIPVTEINYRRDIDKYPVYFLEVDCGMIQKESSNMREFLDKIFPNDRRLDVLSTDSVVQELPRIILT
jgi:hypothetical protein